MEHKGSTVGLKENGGFVACQRTESFSPVGKTIGAITEGAASHEHSGDVVLLPKGNDETPTLSAVIPLSILERKSISRGDNL